MTRILGAVAGMVVASVIGLAATPEHREEPEVRQTMPAIQAKRIRKLAEENNAALMAGNYARAVDLMYPGLVEIVGGREKMIHLLRGRGGNTKTYGDSITTIEVSEPKELVTAANKQFAIVPVSMRLDAPEGTMRMKTFLIAISSDRGRTWTFIDGEFIDGAKFTRQDLTKIIPRFPTQLSLPVIEQRVLEPR